MLKNKIIEDLQKALKELNFPSTDIVCTIPKNTQFGDYSTNVALQLAKLNTNSNKQNPMEIANKILEKLGTPDYLEKAEVAGGGFINFFIKTNELVKNLDKPIQNSSNKIEEKIMVEYTDPNPFKQFHIGHTFSNAVGESMARLFEYKGAKVFRANFFGDVGMHAAKAIFGIKSMLKDQALSLDDLGKKPLNERIKFMGQGYAQGATAYEENPQAQEAIKRINLLAFIGAQNYWKESKGWEPRVNYRKLIESIDEDELEEIQNLWVTGRTWSLEYFETIYALLGTKFDGYYPESLTGEWGYEFVMDGLKKGIFEESDGAIVYKGEKHGLHTRVFINKLGLPTYETKDIGLAPHKYSEFEYDKSVIVTANEINEYFKVIISAMKEVNPTLGEKTIHLGHGVVRLKEGKMSSRTGKIFTFESLFEAVKTNIEDVVKDIPQAEREQTINQIAVGAIKFAMLKHSPSVDTIFDLEKSVALEGDSGPYVQYTYARARSILRKEQNNLGDLKLDNLNLESEERILLQKIEYFDGVVDEALNTLHPNIIATYLVELASNFNLFYQKHRIVDAKEDKKNFRLMLTRTVSEILKQGLHLLGIEAPERM